MHKDYKMSKALKTMLALGRFKSKEDRSLFKRSMIIAEATAERSKKESSRNRNNDE